MAERLTNPIRIPPKPRVRSEAEFNRLPKDQQAALIHEAEDWWRDTAPSATGVSGVNFAGIAVQGQTPRDVDYKGPGFSQRQRAEDAANDMREANRIRNQGL
jgi:hypothetical protein